MRTESNTRYYSWNLEFDQNLSKSEKNLQCYSLDVIKYLNMVSTRYREEISTRYREGEQCFNPQTPVAQKSADEVVFRHFRGEGVEFFQIGPH